MSEDYEIMYGPDVKVDSRSELEKEIQSLLRACSKQLWTGEDNRAQCMGQLELVRNELRTLVEMGKGS